MSRNQFVSNASHELKTPLSTMKILLETLLYQDAYDPQMQKEFLTDINKEIDNTAQVERVARLLSECFGGATSSPARGYWVAQDGALVAEKTTMVFAYCDTAAAEKYIDDVVTLCNELKHEMGQEAVALEYNGSMYFI